jgi:hypothetical protein
MERLVAFHSASVWQNALSAFRYLWLMAFHIGDS